MKQVIFLLGFAFVSNFSYSQFYLGGRITQVMNMINEDKANSALEHKVLSGISVLMWRNEKSECSMLLQFNSKDIAVKYHIFPDNAKKIAAMLNYFNTDKQFIKISDDQWTMFSVSLDRGIDIKFSYTLEKQAQFAFSIRPGLND